VAPATIDAALMQALNAARGVEIKVVNMKHDWRSFLICDKSAAGPNQPPLESSRIELGHQWE